MQTQTHAVTFSGVEVRKRYVTWAERQPEREWTALHLLHEHARGLAPRPLRREFDGEAPVIVMERVPGVPFGSAPLTAEQTAALATALIRLFGVPESAVRASSIGERRTGPTELRATLAEWMDRPRDLSTLDDRSTVEQALRRGEALVAGAHSFPNPAMTALGIADLNPSNIMWDGRVCRLIDFEDAGLTDPAFELAGGVEHLAARIGAVYDADDLIGRMGLTEVERERVRRYRPFWALYWLVLLLPGNPAHHRNPRGTAEWQARHVLDLLDGS